MSNIVNMSGQLVITCMHADGIPNVQMIGKQDPYVKIEFGSKKKQSKVVQFNNINGMIAVLSMSVFAARVASTIYSLLGVFCVFICVCVCVFMCSCVCVSVCWFDIFVLFCSWVQCMKVM